MVNDRTLTGAAPCASSMFKLYFFKRAALRSESIFISGAERASSISSGDIPR